MHGQEASRPPDCLTVLEPRSLASFSKRSYHRTSSLQAQVAEELTQGDVRAGLVFFQCLFRGRQLTDSGVCIVLHKEGEARKLSGMPGLGCRQVLWRVAT